MKGHLSAMYIDKLKHDYSIIDEAIIGKKG